MSHMPLIQLPHTHGEGCLCNSPAFIRINTVFSQKATQSAPITAATVAAAVPGAKSQKRDVAANAVRVVAFINVRVFDGVSDQLRDGLRVLVEGNKIKSVEPADTPLSPDVELIDGGGGVLMPGLIDAHWHAIMARPSMMTAMTADFNYIQALAIAEADATLMRGFTTVRDMGGPVFGLKRAIDEHVAIGPRIFPSGAFITQTGGHGDFRLLGELPHTPSDPLSYAERVGMTAIADGADQVLLRAREQLMRGASQLKYMAGGVSSMYDSIDVTEGSVAEIQAAVTAAENWGTYVTVHAYTPRAVTMAIKGGVKCIEHGQLLDEETVQLMAEKGIWWSLQPFLDDEDAVPTPSPASRAKQLEMVAGTDTAYMLAKKYNIKTAWGTDTLFDARLATRQGAQLAKLTRWYSPLEILKMATSVNAELCAFSGPRNPYPGKLGVVENGALADLILVDGNPLDDIQLVAQPDKAFRVIMKDGQIFKNTLGSDH
ncbi:metal-dependent hydrolase family protein [Yersinia enterocolitica]|uniref:metal-dependent hydrolase family protein n=1 Tax=Yersinia enterocolitica TaxID=630 RepID=UPI0021E79849|nr:amidohydrolase family protein [Yersinia enterocolitica]MCV3312020.1 amidohydrolase family protein [Yersinia enterocolitica]UYJ89956.1 amidohydrolase family protein [Yersinia enterocolitica]UYJ93989.1 amidohydrolase family protein [Yersinia enterocolitica]UYK23447.1 amidohydrolase family protein [Yersinia enterocolitica]UYK27426.1 amidohydrolase family protein [Yersinia enterocolitica]